MSAASPSRKRSLVQSRYRSPDLPGRMPNCRGPPLEGPGTIGRLSETTGMLCARPSRVVVNPCDLLAPLTARRMTRRGLGGVAGRRQGLASEPSETWVTEASRDSRRRVVSWSASEPVGFVNQLLGALERHPERLPDVLERQS